MSECVCGYYLSRVFPKIFAASRGLPKGYLSCYNREKGGQEDMPHQIKVTDELYDRLKERANGQPIPQLLRALLDGEEFKDEGERLLEQLDYQNEHPESALSPEDQELFERLEPGELPECCQEYYTSGTKCRHWHKEYVNYYGKRVIGYRNTLTGGTNYDYQTLYRQ